MLLYTVLENTPEVMGFYFIRIQIRNLERFVTFFLMEVGRFLRKFIIRNFQEYWSHLYRPSAPLSKILKSAKRFGESELTPSFLSTNFEVLTFFKFEEFSLVLYF